MYLSRNCKLKIILVIKKNKKEQFYQNYCKLSLSFCNYGLMTSLGIYHIALIVQGRRNVSNIGWA